MNNEVYVIGRDVAPQYLRLEAGEELSMTLVVPPATDTRLVLEVDLTGPGASLDLAGLYLCPDAENDSSVVPTVNFSGASSSLKSVQEKASARAPNIKMYLLIFFMTNTR